MESAFVTIECNEAGVVQVKTNVNDPAKINWYLDAAKFFIMKRTMENQSLIQAVPAGALPADPSKKLSLV